MNHIKYKSIRANSRFALFFILFLSGLFSCKKYTELTPFDSLSESTAFSDSSSIEQAAAGMYNAAEIGNYNYGGDGRGYPFGAAVIELEETRGENSIDVGGFYGIIYQNTETASSANVTGLWNDLYRLVNETNVFITGVQGAQTAKVISTATATQYLAEAYFLRALAHHEIVLFWSRPYLDNQGANPGIPYRDYSINNPAGLAKAQAQTRGTVADDYKAILTDLDAAEAGLPETRANQLNITRATKGAAIALKTRIKLHMGDWQGVLTESAKLVSGSQTSPINGYQLTASPETPFSSQSNNTESIFSIENSSLTHPSVNGALASMFGAADLNGRGLVLTSPNLWNASFWPTNDLRRTLLFHIGSDANGDENVPMTTKYRDYANFSDYAPVIRYAEVLLNEAEASARLNGVNTQAINDLAAVRNRSNLLVADQYSAASFSNQTQLVQAILNERQIELNCEGRRWADISRLATDPVYTIPGVPAKVDIANIAGDGSDYNLVTRPVLAPTIPAVPYAGSKFLWQIPDAEEAANPILTQNP